MKYIFTSLFCTLLFINLHGQTTVGGAPGKGLEMNTYSGGAITEIHTTPPPAKGTTYISDQWNLGSVYLYNLKKVEEYPLKYEIDLNIMEIKAGDDVKVIDGYRIYQFNWFDSQLSKVRIFINAKDYELEGVQLTGILEVISSGENYSLFARYSTEVIPSNYVKALDIGEKAEKIVKNTEHFIFHDGSMIVAEKSKKKLAGQFDDKASQVLSYIKSNHLNCREEEDLTKIVSFANDL